MVVDHIKYAIPSTWNNFTLYFGRISFPLFVFCTVEGYKHTSNFKKYLRRILIAAILSQIPFVLFCSLPTLNKLELNVMFNLAFGLVAIKLYEIVDNKFLKYFCVISMGILSFILNADYKMYGVILMFTLYLFSDNKLKLAIAYFIVVTSRYIFRYFYYGSSNITYMVKTWLCTLIPLIFIILYNGKKGPSIKKFYYWFYPVHMLVLYLISPYTGIINIF
jgi:hypothetical protein